MMDSFLVIPQLEQKQEESTCSWTWCSYITCHHSQGKLEDRVRWGESFELGKWDKSCLKAKCFPFPKREGSQAFLGEMGGRCQIRYGPSDLTSRGLFCLWLENELRPIKTLSFGGWKVAGKSIGSRPSSSSNAPVKGDECSSQNVKVSATAQLQVREEARR